MFISLLFPWKCCKRKRDERFFAVGAFSFIFLINMHRHIQSNIICRNSLKYFLLQIVQIAEDQSTKDRN